MEWYGSNLIRRHQHRFRPFFFCEKPLVKNTFFKSFPKKTSDFESQKSGFGFDPTNPPRECILWIHDPFLNMPKKTQNLFLDSEIRIWIWKSVFGFENPYLDFPEKTHPNIHVSSNGVSKKSNCWLCRVLTTLTTESLIGILETGHVNLSRQYREAPDSLAHTVCNPVSSHFSLTLQ